MKLIMGNKKYFYLLIVLFNSTIAIPPINIFRPTDRVLIPEPIPGVCFQFFAGCEGSLDAKGFQDDFEDCVNCNRIEKDDKVNVLQIYQNRQNFLSALKGLDSNTSIGQLSQSFNINDDNGTIGFFKPIGDFKVPFNFLFSSYLYFNPNIWLSFNLSVLKMELNKIRWQKSKRTDNEDDLTFDKSDKELINTVADFLNIDLRPWSRTGLGDFIIETGWYEDFPQFQKTFLINVRPQLRVGINIPTAVTQDENKILALPFGNNGSWGIQIAGGLDLDFVYRTRFGLDVQLLFLFGNIRDRRLKIDCNQTDLLFPVKIPAYRDYGLGQQFNLFLENFGLYNICGLSFKLNYQYLKRNEDQLFFCKDKIDPLIVNGAESLQDWTAHSFIFKLTHDWAFLNPDNQSRPAIDLWFKLGFNGKRAILLNTLGAAFTFRY